MNDYLILLGNLLLIFGSCILFILILTAISRRNKNDK